MKRKLLKQRSADRYFIILLIALNCFVYFPSLFHAPRGDHTSFLAQVSDKTDIKKLVSFTYSYNRTRQFHQYDRGFFRPLFYLILALEKLLFGYRYYFWQMTGIILHWFVIWKLYRILTSLKSSLFAFLLPLSFSVVTISQEMIVWHHIHGYLLGVFLSLCALEAFIKYINAEESRNRHVWSMSLYLTFAGLAYEPGLVLPIAFIFSIVLDTLYSKFFKYGMPSLSMKSIQEIKAVFILSLPLIIYGIWNTIDMKTRGCEPDSVQNMHTFLQTISSFFTIGGVSIVGPFVPSYLKINLYSKTYIQLWGPPSFLRFLKVDQTLVMANHGLIILLISGTVYLLVFLFKQKGKLFDEMKTNIQENKKMFWVAVVSLIFNLALISVLSQTRGALYVLKSSYHYYPIGLFNILFIYSFFCLLPSVFKKKRKLGAVFVIILIVASTLNGIRSYTINDLIKKKDEAFFKFQDIVGADAWHRSNRFVLFADNEYAKNDLEKSLVYFNKALNINPYNVFALNGRGLVGRDLQLYELAIRDFSRAIKVAPQFSEAYNNRGLLFVEMKEYRKGLDDLSRAIGIAPHKYVTYINRGEVFLELGEYESAIEDFNKSLTINPENERALEKRRYAHQRFQIQDE